LESVLGTKVQFEGGLRLKIVAPTTAFTRLHACLHICVGNQ
jgi:hypothetical protein